MCVCICVYIWVCALYIHMCVYKLMCMHGYVLICVCMGIAFWVHEWVLAACLCMAVCLWVCLHMCVCVDECLWVCISVGLHVFPMLTWVHTWACACVCFHKCVWLHVCAWLSVLVCVFICLHGYVCVWMCACMYIWMGSACIRVCVCVCVCACKYLYIFAWVYAWYVFAWLCMDIHNLLIWCHFQGAYHSWDSWLSAFHYTETSPKILWTNPNQLGSHHTQAWGCQVWVFADVSARKAEIQEDRSRLSHWKIHASASQLQSTIRARRKNLSWQQINNLLEMIHFWNIPD
jgi:hypothetical protein